jgi:DNA-3-methyladenine glycosylase II
MEYLTHLAKDRRLKRLIDQHTEPLTIKRQKDMVFYLCASIMSQQLSTKVVNTIRQRYLDLFGGRAPAPQQILETPPATLRAIGLSNSKVNYVLNVARFAIEEGLDHRQLEKLDNEAVIAYVTRIKGVGRWTAEMLLMFGLGREDVFAIDDWGIQNAMIAVYKLNREDKKAFREKMSGISAKWSPYRTYACLYLWRYKDNRPIGAPNKRAVAASKKRAVAASKKRSGAAPKKS